MVTLPYNLPRKAKSAFDLKNLVLSDPALNRSVIRLNFARDEVRRSSILAGFEKAQCHNILPENRRPESRNNSISGNIRRGSIFPDSCRNTLSVDNSDRLAPPIKSGVLDFRRNSMMIINNLTQDFTPAPFYRNMSLGGSNVNLAPEMPTAAQRRNSVIPPYGLTARSKSKSPLANDKYITNQKASKSLDSEVPRKQNLELRNQFLHPLPNKRGSLSSETLTTTEYPKIIETICTSPVPSSADDQNVNLFFGESSSYCNLNKSESDVAIVTNTVTVDIEISPYKVTNV